MAIPCELWQLGFDCEISNNSAMAFELVIASIFAIAISIIFYRRQELQRKKIDEIIVSQDKAKKERLEYFSKNLHTFLLDAKTYIDFVRKNRKNDDDEIKHEVEGNRMFAGISLDNASKYLQNAYDLAQPSLLQKIRNIIRAGRIYSELGFFPDTDEEDFVYDFEKNWDKDIGDVLDQLDNLKKL